ncbi:unnamed protein product [[Candida] boidinii]|nr:unnamed protein product [[Candida] boidinii]
MMYVAAEHYSVTDAAAAAAAVVVVVVVAVAVAVFVVVIVMMTVAVVLDMKNLVGNLILSKKKQHLICLLILTFPMMN